MSAMRFRLADGLAAAQGCAVTDRIPKLLDGKTALVVGGGRGIGRAVSLTLGGSGADVALVDLEGDRAEAVANELRAAGATAVPLTADIRDADQVRRVVRAAVDELGGIDVLVTVVGGQNAFAAWQPTHQWSDEEWDLVVGVNLRYVFLVAREVIGVMLEQGRGGAIVNIGSVSGMAGAPNHSAYGAAKAGVIHLAKSLALEYGRYGIRVNVVSPGVVRTPATEGALTPEQDAAMAEKIPLVRPGAPQDIADAVLFFASPLAAYVTGQVIAVDGGVSARFPLPLPGGHPSEAV
jgi:3-oxoacyl-[acyl-carrier protein] reductase